MLDFLIMKMIIKILPMRYLKRGPLAVLPSPSKDNENQHLYFLPIKISLIWI